MLSTALERRIESFSKGCLMSAITFTLIPLFAMTLGAVATALRPPSPGLKSGIQHFAAGVVFAAAASEILPDVALVAR